MEQNVKKLCKKCGVEKELKFMVKHKGAKDGYLYKCQECHKKQVRINKGASLDINVHEKYCPVCKLTKVTDEFNVSTRSEDGLQFLCRNCYDIHMEINKGVDKNYFRKLRSKVDVAFKESLQEAKRLNARKNHITSMLSNARCRAVKKGLEFSLTKEDIIIPEICPILKVPFIQGTKDNYDFTPTIDRIDNSKGYTVDNIQIITNKANSMKNSATPEMLQNFIISITNDERYSPNNDEKEIIDVQDKELVR